jgi:Uncharacterized conserved protein
MHKNLILQKERLIASLPDRVWTVLTNNEYIEQWLGVKMITNWQVGSPIAFTIVWKDKEIKDKGAILEFDPGKKFTYNYWSVFSAMPDSPEYYSVISFNLVPESNSTLLRLTQTNFSTHQQYTHSDKHWEETLDVIRNLAEAE